MTKELKYSVIIIFASLLFIMLIRPFEAMLQEIFERPLLSKLVAGSTVRLLLSLALTYIIIKRGFLKFNGLSPFSFSNPLFVLFTVGIIIVLAYSSYDYYFETSTEMLLLFSFDQALIGIFEELLFRGIILPLLILHFAEKQRPVLKAVFLSSLMFGFIHIVGLIRNPENFWGVINTIIFATGIGFFLAVLFLRTRNILVPVFLHFLIDFTNGAAVLKEEIITPDIPSSGTILLTLAVLIAMCFFLIGIGMILYKRVNQEEWIGKVSPIKI